MSLFIMLAATSAPPGWVLPLFTVIGSVGFFGGIGSLFYVRATGRKLNASARKMGVDADVALSGQALEWLRDARDASAKAEAKVERCRAELEALRDHVTDVLEPMMREQGMRPPPFIWPRIPDARRAP